MYYQCLKAIMIIKQDSSGVMSNLCLINLSYTKLSQVQKASSFNSRKNCLQPKDLVVT